MSKRRKPKSGWRNPLAIKRSDTAFARVVTSPPFILGMIALLVVSFLMFVTPEFVNVVGPYSVVCAGVQGMGFALSGTFLAWIGYIMLSMAWGSAPKIRVESASRAAALGKEFGQILLSVFLYCGVFAAGVFAVIPALFGQGLLEGRIFALVIFGALLAGAIWWRKRRTTHPRSYDHVGALLVIAVVVMSAAGALFFGGAKVGDAVADAISGPVVASGEVVSVSKGDYRRRLPDGYDYAVVFSANAPEGYGGHRLVFSFPHRLEDSETGTKIVQGHTCVISFYPRTQAMAGIRVAGTS